MSEANLELARRAMQSAEDFFELLDEYVVRDNRAYPLVDFLDVEVGREAVMEGLRQYWGAFEDYSIEAQKLIDAGQSVILVIHEQARGKGSGAPIKRDWAQIWTFRTGRIIRMDTFPTLDEALEAAGLAE